ncbi:hypothetical protein AB0E63_06295 [Kribbella sp. NPDC026596]|uniref:hypothetical protein n=1 Tax=Kribbella sp. NPDC026596 TaxID=3155122 RepID=UPI0033F4DDA0
MSIMLCTARTTPIAAPTAPRESWLARLVTSVRRPSRDELANDAYDCGKLYGEHLGRLLAWDLYRPLVEAAKVGNLSSEQVAAVAEFVDECATEKLNPGAR